MINYQRLYNWFQAPEFPTDEEKNRRAYLCNLIFQAGMIFLAVTLMIFPFVRLSPNIAQYLAMSITLLLGFILTKIVLNYGWVNEAGYLLAAVFWITFAVNAIKHSDGIVSVPFLAAATVTPIIVGFVNGTRASIIITLLNWLMGGYFTWLTMSGRVATQLHEDPLVQYLGLMVLFSTFPLLVYIWRRNFKDALKQVHIVDEAHRETAAYRLQNEALETAVQRRTSALEASLEREQHLAEKLALALELETQLGQLQSRIITVVSHEFRTPLSVINSSSELLRQYYDKLPIAKRESAHLRIREAIFYLHGLLKDVTLVDMAQRAQIRPSYQTFVFNNLCRQLSDALLEEVNQPDRLIFDFGQQIETPLQVDLTLLQQIVVNLVSNALKYSAEDKKVQVCFWLDRAQLVIEVQDEGIGIPLHEQSKVFELFYRASNVDEKRGLGLGLFIVQAISRMLQGQAAVKSLGEGRGTTVIVRLPFMPNIELG